MASEQQVKQYLAYWFQLGKKIMLRNGKETILPKSIIEGNRYSSEFEVCWQKVISPESGDCYLEGTIQSIQELLTPAWEINPCARCKMPVPVVSLGIQPLPCPCNDLPQWPNKELPTPRSPVDNISYLNRIREHLDRTGKLN